MNWKIERDYFFKELYEKKGMDHINDCGFFFDSSNENYNLKDSVNLLCTPINFLLPKLKKSKNPAILLTTGSMCPIHDGHIEMMENAKKAVEEAGYNVIGGYISPDHDEYIFSKVKEGPIPIHQRIYLINEAIKNIDWLSVDPYNGVFAKVAVNYTDIIYRMKLYIKKHTGKEVPIFFVCGGDNARFAKTFLFKGHCVVVGRPGSEDKFTILSNIMNYNKNVLFINAKNTNSSTKVRKEFKYEFKKKDLNLRVEEGGDKTCEIEILLHKYFKKIEYQYIISQKIWFGKFNVPIISLDSQIQGEQNLFISRKYDLFGIKKIGYSNRPNTSSLKKQILSIPSHKYYFLYDDDIHTGNTMRYVKGLLEKNNRWITGFLSFNINKSNEQEILDQRDFLIGGKDNGLLIELPNGEISRVPYVYPYVDPFIRASINDPMNFSKDVWKYNYNFYKDKNTTLGDLSYLRVFFYIGFNKKTKISDICKWHLEKI